MDVDCKSTPRLCMKPWTTKYVKVSDTFMYYNRHTATVHVHVCLVWYMY